MKKIILTFSFLSILSAIAQIPAYYNSIDFTADGMALKSQLSDLITTTHTSPTTYSQVWDVLKESDLAPGSSTNVLLIYGHNDSDGDITNDRTRNKNNNGGDVGEWNREHVFPKSLASPNLGTTGAGADPHNLRASDVQKNGQRGSRKFASGSGVPASIVGTNWYPGDEWKGDAARIVMYMYLRYGSRCYPNAATVGITNEIDPNMVNILLDWNASDEVSTMEMNRNNVIYNEIGNRNPFIDNPYIATLIWGGTVAPDLWTVLGNNEIVPEDSFSIYPNPSNGGNVSIRLENASNIKNIKLININGEVVKNYSFDSIPEQTIQLNTSGYPKGVYFVTIQTITGIKVEKLIIQ